MLKDAINECLEVNKYIKQVVCLMMSNSNDQQYEESAKQLSNIPFAQRQSSTDKIFSTYTPLIDERTMPLTGAQK